MAHFAALKTVFEPVFGIDLSLPAATVPRADRDDPVQASPVAASDYTFTNQDAPVTFHVLANDTDADNDPLTIVTIQNPANGSVVKNANQTLTYVPDAGFSGTDVFFYSATDGSGASYANVFVTVHPAPATPVLPGTEFLSYNFDFGTEGMSYVDGAFRGASAGSYSGGSMSAGALAVTLGGTDNAVVDDMAGAWKVDFFLATAKQVILRFDYTVTMAGSFESNEKLDLLLALDFTLIGASGGAAIATYPGLNQAAAFSTGTIAMEMSLGDVAQGHHVIELGAFLNRKNQSDEVATVTFDNVAIYTNDAAAPGTIAEPTPQATTVRLTTNADTFRMLAIDEEIDGSFGDDTINGMGGDDLIFGSDGNDILKGAKGADELVGGSGRDLLIGGSGADIFWGGAGLDTLVGDPNGSGAADRFCFSALDLDAVDRIRDFDIAEGDILDLSNLVTGFVDGVSVVSDFVKFIDIGTKTVVKVDADGGGDSFHKLLFLNGVTGVTDVNQLYLDGTIDLI